MFDTPRTWLRLAAIIRILAIHDIEPIAERFFPYRVLTWLAGINPATYRFRRNNSSGARIRLAMERLGPTFIKFGQAISTRVDAIPDDMGLEMKKLQDDVPPFPFAQVRAIVEGCLDGPLEQFFSRFDEKPVASGSIAQVHHAFTRQGREVAVKVKRPGINAVVKADIQTLYYLADLIEEHIPDWRRFHVHRVVNEFAATIRNEMNFHLEASRAQEFRINFLKDPELHIPEVYWPLTSQDILTLEWIKGIPIDELSRFPGDPLDVIHISNSIVSVFFKQVFRDGYFHADQHPGNLLVRDDGTLVAIDFGIIGRVDLQTRIWLADMLHGFLERDYKKVARVHLDAGYIPFNTNLADFEEACRQIGEPIFGQPLKEISLARLLSQLFKTTERFAMEVQPQLLLLQKTMLTLEGVGREINPNLNVWLLAEPLIRAWMKENLGPKGKLRSLHKDAGEMATTVGLLPKVVHTAIERMARDQFRPRLHPESLAPLEDRLKTGLRTQTYALTGGACLITAAILESAGKSLWLTLPLVLMALYNFLRTPHRSRRLL
ncbi:MAG: 2-polyprenylphenol 6-hydroxylase [Magnetococcales bacterium]|nr:2-polyprenylphenol 6-hydroxylase [Magnetococcales bacterium]